MKDTDRESPKFFGFVLASIFLTGFSGLVYEVTWQRYLANFLGSESKSNAIILSVFLGGLAIGYHFFGRLTRHASPRKLVKLCGAAEIGIGIWAAIFPNLYSFIWDSVRVIDPESAFATLYEIFLTSVLIGVPTVLMGCTLPLLTQGMSSRAKSVPRIHAQIYTWNTVGAFLGCLLAGFVLLPFLGLPLTIMTTASLNIISGCVLIIFGNQLSAEAPQEDRSLREVFQENIARNRKTNEVTPFGIAFLGGFIGLTFQTLLMRIAGLSLGSSDYTFSMIVAIYILMLALGASRLGKSDTPITARSLVWNQILLILGLGVFYFAVPFLPYSNFLVRTQFTPVVPAFYFYYVVCGALFGLLLLAPLAATGRTMPLLVGYLQPKIAGAGKTVGRLYSWNSFGCVLGALVGGYFLLFPLNLDSILKVSLALSSLSLILMVFLLELNLKIASVMATAVVLFVGLFSTVPSWDKNYLGMGLFRSQTPVSGMYEGRNAVFKKVFETLQIIDRKDDPNTSVSVGEIAKPSANGYPITRSIVVNGKSDGATSEGDLRTNRLIAHLAMMFSGGSNTKAAIVGFGTGATSGSLTLYPELTDVHCIEISPGVREFSKYFSFINHDVTHNSKFHWHSADAYRFLASHTDKYRVIISEPSNPWVGGVERLYTTEFYNRVKTSLDSEGIFAQWVQNYSMSEPTLSMIFNTISTAFKYTRVVSVVGIPDLIILGSHSPIGVTQLDAMKRRWEGLAEVRKDLGEVGYKKPVQLLSGEMEIPTHAFSNSAIHTLDFPKLSFAAGRDFFQNNQVKLDQFFEVSDLSAWAGLYRPSALLTLWFQQPGIDKKENLADIARAQCGLKEPKLFPNWLLGSRMCRGALASLVALGEIPTDSTVNAQELAWIRGFMKINLGQSKMVVGNQEKKVEESKKAIRLFHTFNSSIASFSPEPLLDVAQPCFVAKDKDALQCRTQLVGALLNGGFAKEAKAQLLMLDQDPSTAKAIPPSVLKGLGEKIAISEDAQKLLRF